MALLPVHLSNALLFGYFAGCAHVDAAIPIHQLVKEPKETKKRSTYHAMTANPTRAEIQLNTRATIPRAVNPAGNGFGGTLAPVKSRNLTVFPAALPSDDIFPALQSIKVILGNCRALLDF